MSIQIIPFHNDLLPQAAKLLARRHANERVSLPAMPSRFEDIGEAQKAIRAAFARQHASGYAAMGGGRLVAYLIGDLVIDQIWGRSGWIRTPGCAYDLEGDVEIVRDLYAALGSRWVEHGVFFHYALIPVSDPALVQAWFSLSFGIQQVHALLDLETLAANPTNLTADIETRKAGSEDRQHLAEMSDVIWKFQVGTPVWGPMMPELVSETREGWSELVDDPEVTTWLAFQNGKCVSVQAYWPAEAVEDNLFIPENCVYLGVAGTRTEARGMGIGTWLTHNGLAEARRTGFRTCETDWRSTNLLSSRFWPRRGFRPAVYRLVRRLDERIAWADGSLRE